MNVDVVYLAMVFYLASFAMVLGFAIVCAHKKRYKMLQTLKRRPNVKYVKKRLLVTRVFKEMFSEIQCLAKKTLSTEVPTKPFGGKSSFKALELSPDVGSRSTIAVKPGEKIERNAEDMLMEKMTNLYELLMEEEHDKCMMHKAIRFEIKKNCIKNPYDIFGSQLSKKIESAFQDIVDTKEKPSCFRFWYGFFCNLGSICWLKSKMGHISSITDHEKTWLTILIVSATLVVVVTIYRLVQSKLWLELGLLSSLVLLNFIIVCSSKERSFYAKFKLSSIIVCVSKAIFFMLGLYLYDYASDIEVFINYRTPQSCNDTLIPSSSIFPVYSIIGYIKNVIGADTTINGSEIHGPMILLAALLAYTTIVTIPSLHCIKNQIYVSLVMEGKLKKNVGAIEIDYTQLSRKDYNKEEEHTLSLRHIIKRNDLSISEAGTESTYQFMFQWGLFLTMNYWISLADVAGELFPPNFNYINATKRSLFEFISERNLTEEIVLSYDDICGIKNDMNFGFLWKSGMISLFSLSLAQLKLNNIQHELSIDVKQKLLYFMASVSNTVSYTSLLVLWATNFFDFIPIIKDHLEDHKGLKDHEDSSGLLLGLRGTTKVEFWAVYIFSLIPIITRLTVCVLNKCCCNNTPVQENVDILAETHEKHVILQLR